MTLSHKIRVTGPRQRPALFPIVFGDFERGKHYVWQPLTYKLLVGTKQLFRLWLGEKAEYLGVTVGGKQPQKLVPSKENSLIVERIVDVGTEPGVRIDVWAVYSHDRGVVHSLLRYTSQ